MKIEIEKSENVKYFSRPGPYWPASRHVRAGNEAKETCVSHRHRSTSSAHELRAILIACRLHSLMQLKQSRSQQSDVGSRQRNAALVVKLSGADDSVAHRLECVE
jgi:hypothetical protein